MTKSMATDVILSSSLTADPTPKESQPKSLKERFGVVFSILMHLLLLLSAIRVFDQDRYRPTSTRGYTVDLVAQPEQEPPPPAANPAAANTPATTTAGTQDKLLNTKAQVNFKDNSEELAKQAEQKKEEAAKLAAAKAKSREVSHEKAEERRMEAAAKRAQLEAAQAAKTPTQQPPQPKSVNNPGQQVAQQQKQMIVPASAPVVDTSKEGAGDSVDSSTNGDGTQDGNFDFRVIEYGREAAYAINQNIVVPDSYRNVHVTYRAFVTLDQNMQFQSMQLIKSTGDTEFDANIARALRQTVYPPLPPGADWKKFHNIDFTIH